MVREMDFVDECYADKDLSLLKKLTLVIPTYNRNYYLSRCLWYHAHFPFGQIIVADSSPEEKKVVNRETVAKVREMFGSDILYLEYEPETEKYGGDIYRKWGDAVMHVETEYSQICTDKEFLVPTTLCSLLGFLESNIDYVVASGNFLYYDKSLRIGLSGRRSSTNDDGVKRYCESLDSGWNQSQLLSLHRSEIQKEIYQPIINASINDIRFGERYVAFISYAYGKMYHVNLSYNIRDIANVKNPDNSINKNESSTLRYPQLVEYDSESDYYQHSYDGCHNAILQILYEYGQYDTDRLESLWKSTISPILTRVGMSHPNYISQIFHIIMTITPEWILNIYRNKYAITPDKESDVILKTILSNRSTNSLS